MPATAEVNFAGYLKSFVVAQRSVNNDVLDLPATFQSQNSSRWMLDYFDDSIAVQIHYELNPVLLSRDTGLADATFAEAASSYRLSDIQPILTGDNKNRWYQNLDRFNLQWQLGDGDLTVGRQAITFGSARIINPSDVFVPFDVRTFNTEYRNGVDGLRYQQALGDLGELDVGIVLGRDADPDDSAAFVQTRLNSNGVDYSFAVITYSEQNLISAGLQSSLGEFGFWVELASVSGDESYLRASTGLDYAFSENVFGQVEYHYNGAGSSETSNYLASASRIAYQRGGVFLLGEHYLIPSVTYQASALWNFSVQGILNFTDDSQFIALSGERSLTNNLYADIGAYFFNGDAPTRSPIGTPLLQSEYGGSPTTMFVSLRYYF